MQRHASAAPLQGAAVRLHMYLLLLPRLLGLRHDAPTNV